MNNKEIARLIWFNFNEESVTYNTSPILIVREIKFQLVLSCERCIN